VKPCMAIFPFSLLASGRAPPSTAHSARSGCRPPDGWAQHAFVSLEQHRSVHLPDRPMPVTLGQLGAVVPPELAIAACVATTSSGILVRPARVWAPTRGPHADAGVRCAPSTSATLTSDLPRRIPRYMASPTPAARPASARGAGLWPRMIIRGRPPRSPRTPSPCRPACRSWSPRASQTANTSRHLVAYDEDPESRHS